MKRRKFIQTSSLMTLPVLLSGMEVTAIAKSRLSALIAPGDDRVLVLVQLNGGNDGLNTFIPLDQYSNLMKVRSSLMLPEADVLKASTVNGFHKGLKGFSNLYNDGQLAVVQAVGYPNQNRSHFRSTDIWTTASDSEQYVSTGWLGRYFDLNYPGYPEAYPNTDFPDPFAITLGSIVSETCQGVTSSYSFVVSNAEDVNGLIETEAGTSDGSCNSSELSFVKDIVRQTNAYSSQVTNAFKKGSNLEVYPNDNSLAGQLKIVANLISGGLKTKIYVVSQGGFDTHANQVVGGDPVNGTHTELLTSLGDAIQAFQKDLIKLKVDNRVVGMTFSEFGRRIKENDSFGTDHGTAAPLFVFGTCINTSIYGKNPTITDNVGNDEGVAMQYDFRSVYASLLMDWFKSPKSDIKKILFDDFQHIPFIKDCDTISDTTEFNQNELVANISPNPAADYINLTFNAQNGFASADIFDVRGFVVKNIFSKNISSETVNINVPLSDLSQGIYFVRVVQGNLVQTVKFVKGI
jgi:uncharacterized protein (DUF1501 family)